MLSGAGDPQRAETALAHARELLFDRENRIVKLFDPPFAGAERPGYVAAYGPGFRENGGQYTHGALWLVSALLRTGKRAEAWELLSALLPADRDTAEYRGEPYVLAADVYAAPGHVGEAGWTWYTGSSGWLFRIVTEDLLGLRLRDGRLFLSPQLPPDWDGCRIRCRGHDIAVARGTILVDGKPYRGEGLAV